MTFKKGLHVFFCKNNILWASFYEIKQEWGPFCPDFQRFSQIFKDFARIFNKSKLFRVRLHPTSYTTG